MARAPYDEGVPSVAPTGPVPNAYQRIDAPIGAFGGLQGRALEQSGSQLEKAGGDITQIALLQQGRYNEIAHQEATNDFLQQVQGIAWGTAEKKGVLQLQGADALGAWQQAQGDIDDLRVRIRGGLHNDAQRLAFDQTSRFYQLREQDRIGQHVDSQVRHYAIDTSEAGVKSAAMRAGGDPTSDLDTLVREGYINGTRLVQAKDGAAADPMMFDVGRRVAAGSVVYSRLNSLAESNPAAAGEMLKNGTIPSPDGKSRVSIQSVLDETGRTQLAQKIEARVAQSVGTRTAIGEFQTASKANTGPIADRTLPPEAQKFLPALSGGEGNYTSRAPRGDKSATPIANNRYQFLFNTWAIEAPKAGVSVNDHSPEAQDRVAWNHAQDTYRKQSGGRDLTADIREGGHEATIALALNKVWPSLPGGDEQNTTLPQFIDRMRQDQTGVGGNAPMQPTINDAQGPIPGASRRQAMQNIINNPELQKNPLALEHARTMLDHMFTQDDRAVHIDAEAAFNEWVPQVRLNPSAVDPTRVAADRRLTGEQKSNLLALLGDKSQGDGPLFTRTWQNLYLPVGSPERINSVGDLFSLAGRGLTASGMDKLGKEIKTRDEPETEVKKAAMSGWQMQIEGTAGGVILPGGGLATPGPVSKAKWAAFLGWALPEIEREKSAGKTMAQIISPTGDIAKNLPHFMMTPQEAAANVGGEAAPPTATPAPARAAGAGPVTGQWYIGTRSVPAGTAGARYYNGGPVRDQASWPESAPVTAPHAPTTEGGGIQRETVGGRILSLFGVGGEPEPTVSYGDRLSHYPGAEEQTAARAADFSYGTGNEAFMEGRTQNALSNPSRPGQQRVPIAVPEQGATLKELTNPRFGGAAAGTQQTADAYTRAQLAVLRSPISALGYDPRHINLDTQTGGEMTVAGAYDPKQETIYSNSAYESNIVHESTHRGLEQLRQAGVVPDELWKRLPKEEDIVRYIMALHMGDPEKGRGESGREQRADALWRFGRSRDDPQQYDRHASEGAKGYRSALNELTGIAATYYASRHPGGPR